LKAHPIQEGLKALGGPAVGAAESLYNQWKQSTGEMAQAGSAAVSGNAPSAAVHAVSAIPIVGPAMNKMAEQAPAATPGQSYASKVAGAATLGNVGTAIGTAAQVA